MLRRRDWFLPSVVFAGFLTAAVLASLLVSSARDRAVDALEDALLGEVNAIAASQNQSFANSLGGARDFTRSLGPFELEVGSERDREVLGQFEDLVTSAVYLVDREGTITTGLLLREGVVGERIEWPGYEALVASDRYADGRGGVLPVSSGYGTSERVIAFAFPILDPSTGALQGSIVTESVVGVDTDFNKEIGELRRGETGTYLFYDNRGTVIASNDPSVIGRRLEDERMLQAELGLHDIGDQVVVLAEVPEAGWRVAFRQDRSEFERSLAGPLESVGLILVIVLLAGGAVMTWLLFRRLVAARAEQERLRALAEAQQEFVSIVSHELRTPVAGVLGFLETTIDHWDAMADEERKAAVVRAASNARRLQAMTRDVLDTQTIERGAVVTVTQDLDLREEASVAVESARALDPDHVIELDLPAEQVWVRGDPDRLQQVIANLLDNARKNSPAIAPIEVQVRRRDGEVELSVTDQGPGIAADSLERIFDKFVRGPGDTVTGTGLGLYISRQIITAHDGRIWAESRPGQGATFRFRLPASEPAPTGPAEAATAD